MWPFTKKKEDTEEEKRQKICGEFVKKVNNIV